MPRKVVLVKQSVDKKVARLLDANLNRAREGLRVLEDTARFIWVDDKNFKAFRALRHKMDEITRARYQDLVLARDSQRDLGRIIPEKSRLNVAGLVAANMRRVQEAVRVLEEYSKVFAGAASEFKKLRYSLYVEEIKLVKRLYAEF